MRKRVKVKGRRKLRNNWKIEETGDHDSWHETVIIMGKGGGERELRNAAHISLPSLEQECQKNLMHAVCLQKSIGKILCPQPYTQQKIRTVTTSFSDAFWNDIVKVWSIWSLTLADFESNSLQFFWHVLQADPKAPTSICHYGEICSFQQNMNCWTKILDLRSFLFLFVPKFPGLLTSLCPAACVSCRLLLLVL